MLSEKDCEKSYSVDSQFGFGYYFGILFSTQNGYRMANNSSEHKGFLYTPRDAEIISVSDLTPDEKLFLSG